MTNGQEELLIRGVAALIVVVMASILFKVEFSTIGHFLVVTDRLRPGDPTTSPAMALAFLVIVFVMVMMLIELAAAARAVYREARKGRGS